MVRSHQIIPELYQSRKRVPRNNVDGRISVVKSGIDWLPSEIIQEISNGNEELFQAVRVVEMTRSAIRESNICSLSNNDIIVTAHEGSGNDETSEVVDTSPQVEEPT